MNAKVTIKSTSAAETNNLKANGFDANGSKTSLPPGLQAAILVLLQVPLASNLHSTLSLNSLTTGSSQIHWLCWTKLSLLLINSVLLWVRYRTV
jgi:hypothetical protein